MSEIQEKARESFDNKFQIKQTLALPRNEIDEENRLYVSQLQELARVFSSSGDRHIRQYIINLAEGVLERAGDYKRVEAYVEEVLS
jgi:hypothetical protein